MPKSYHQTAMTSGGDPISIALFDQRPLIGAALAAWLNARSGMRVASVAKPPMSDQPGEPPTVCLVNVAEGSWDWESLINIIRARWSGVPIVMTLGATPDRALDAAMELGVRGLVCEQGEAEDLARAIEAAARGENFRCPGISERLASHESRRPEQSRIASLTAREREVLRHLAGGQTKREIAEVMHLSPKTIDNHATAIMTKLNIHNRVGLARFAIREGIVSP